MPTIYFLNVKEGDCIGIDHYSGHKTVIDVCNAKTPNYLLEVFLSKKAQADLGVGGNFNQKKYPVNPISFFKERGWSNVFRFILTHPDMDHMDGMKVFFEELDPTNFWDTDNTKEIVQSSWENSPFSEQDWSFYKDLRERKPETAPKRLTLFSGTNGKYYNICEDGTSGGDGLYILAPTKELVVEANEAGEDYNRCSYVILYRTGEYRIVFGGDSHDDTWDHIITKHEASVKDIDILIAPHHGRKSYRSYEFLDVLRPKVTFFGNARSEHLAYGAWSNRDLPYITNNQAGSIIADVSVDRIDLYVTHAVFARAVNRHTFYSESFKAYYLIKVV